LADFQWSDSEFQGFKDTNQRNIPEFLHVPAIRDVSEETKNKTDFFGKVIVIIAEALPEEGLQNAKQLENELDKMLNYNGTGADNRLPQIKKLEADLLELVGSYIPNTKLLLQFPIPDYRETSIPSIVVDDGVPGLPVTKGRGLQSILFLAIVRLYEKYLINRDPSTRRP
jgi:putative ATP-dependent endonuclease of OLD family